MASDDGLRYSYDGSGWELGTGVTMSKCTNVAHGLDASNIPIWVAIGTGDPSIQYSRNGKLWYDCTNASFSNRGECLLYANGMWLAGGYDPSTYKNILWSTDGMNWNNDIVFDVPGSSACTIQSIGYDGSGVWMACGNPPDIDSAKNLWTSTNGTSWSSITSPYSNIVLYSIVYGYDSSSNPIWVLGEGTATAIQWSPPGVLSWVTATGITSINNVYNVLYTGTKWLLVGAPTPTSGGALAIQTSTDGRTWNPTNWASSEQLYLFGIGYGNDSLGNPLYIAVGYNGTNNVLYSPDGVTWNTTQGDQPLNGLIGRSVAYAKYAPPPVPPPCFVAGTQILTPSGYKAVEDIQSGEYVVTADKRRVPVKLYSFTTQATADTAPFRIAAHAIGPDNPKRDLHVSPRHAIKDTKGRWQIPKYLAYHNKKIQQYGVGESVTYYHVECPNFYNDNLIAEGMEVESYKNRQGTPGVIYMWNDALCGWDRVQDQKIPKTLTTHVIYSI